MIDSCQSLWLSTFRNDFISSYVPHDKAVAGTLIDILGKIPFLKAPIPSFSLIYL